MGSWRVKIVLATLKDGWGTNDFEVVLSLATLLLAILKWVTRKVLPCLEGRHNKFQTHNFLILEPLLIINNQSIGVGIFD